MSSHAFQSSPHPLLTADPTRLDAHFGHCLGARSSLHRMRGVVEGINALLLPRFLSTLVVSTLLVSAVCWWA